MKKIQGLQAPYGVTSYSWNKIHKVKKDSAFHVIEHHASKVIGFNFEGIRDYKIHR